MGSILNGIDVYRTKGLEKLQSRSVGLVCHASSIDRRLTTSAQIFLEARVLKTLFSPQQGFFGQDQDNMVETDHGLWKGIPLYSLYSETRKPTPHMLKGLDCVVVDLPDVGTRIYTFIYTMGLMMEACAEADIEVVVLDRPNPIGGEMIQGTTLEMEFQSFVGLYPLPTRHGMTIGEIARWVNQRVLHSKPCRLSVVPMSGWERKMYWDQTGLTFIMPSANVPVWETTYIFPGTVYFEGTLISEGRGTTRPLEQIGAPYIDSEKLIAHLNQVFPQWRRGCFPRSTSFRPTFQKLQGKLCHGVFVHPTDRAVFNPVVTGLALMRGIYELYPSDFQWKQPPYEYETTKMPIDVISGSPFVRQWVEGKVSWGDLLAKEEHDTDLFRKEREDSLLY